MELKRYLILAAILLLSCLVGFFIGRATTNGKTIVKTEYITLPSVHDTIVNMKPYYERIPADTCDIIKACIENGIYSEMFPKKVINDTIYLTSEDTLAILRDWASERCYHEILFDNDSVGNCIIDVKTQYNRVDTIEYIFTPIQKTVTVTNYKVKNISPFVGVGMDVNNIGNNTTFDFQAEAGLFIRERNGVSLDYRFDVINKTHSIGCMYKYKF